MNELEIQELINNCPALKDLVSGVKSISQKPANKELFHRKGVVREEVKSPKCTLLTWEVYWIITTDNHRYLIDPEIKGHYPHIENTDNPEGMTVSEYIAAREIDLNNIKYIVFERIVKEEFLNGKIDMNKEITTYVSS